MDTEQFESLNKRIEFQRSLDDFKKSLGIPDDYVPNTKDYTEDIEEFITKELGLDLREWTVNKTLAYRKIKCDDPQLICELGETVCADIRDGWLTMSYLIGGEIKYRIKFKDVAN
ncbi:MAG: hypothetical protein ACRDBG_02950 [Waterburya sp.]